MEETVDNIEIVLLIIFNLGMAYKIIQILLNGMHDEDINVPKELKKYISIVIIINVIGGLVEIIKSYFTLRQ